MINSNAMPLLLISEGLDLHDVEVTGQCISGEVNFGREGLVRNAKGRDRICWGKFGIANIIGRIFIGGWTARWRRVLFISHYV